MKSFVLLTLPYILSAAPIEPHILEYDHIYALLIASSIILIAFIIYSLFFLYRSRNIQTQTGMEEMIGLDAKVLEIYQESYLVKCHSETWEALSDTALEVGQITKVVALDGLLLKVEPKE